MLRISIEIDGEAIALKSVQAEPEITAAMVAAAQPQAVESTVPTWVAQAVATGSQNAGPAPSDRSSVAALSSAPISIIGSTLPEMMEPAEAAGAAPGSPIEPPAVTLEEGAE
jgi:hypothetical protein